MAIAAIITTFTYTPGGYIMTSIYAPRRDVYGHLE